MTTATERRYVSPLRYPGGKAKMVPFLSEVFATQVSFMDVEIWVEPFAGGAGAGLTMLDAGAVGEVWLTEKNPAMAALWRSILDDGERFAARVESAAPDLRLWESARETLAGAEAGERFDDLDLAFAAFIMNRCSRSGMVTSTRVGPIGGKTQAGRWNVTSRWNGPSLAERIRHIHGLRGQIRFNEGDAIDRIAELDGSVGIEDEMLVFVDPPYLREGNRLYAQGMSLADHQRLADALNACQALWLLTYDDEATVLDDLYPDRRVLAYSISNTANRARVATEYAVLSDGLRVPELLEVASGRAATWLRNWSEDGAPLMAEGALV